jgi:2-methylcitrate dehydratase PrpD
MSIAEQLARFVTERQYADLPPVTLDYAAMLVSSTIASASLGSTLASAKIMRALELQRGGTPEASLWFYGTPKLPLAAAARINSLMSDAAASDDSDLRNIAHPGTTLAACALATAEKTGASGHDILAAIVLGYEAAGRINGAVVPGLREKGFHGCVIAIFGGTVATGRLLNLDATQMAHALSLAATSIGGIMAAANTSTAREYHAGLAAMLGVNAAQAAAMGYTAETTIFETKHGFFDVVGAPPDAEKIARVTADFGTRWEILTDMAIKLVPGGHPFHAMAEAAANAARDGNIAPADIAAIILSRPGMRQLSGPRHPTDLIGIAHSPAYFMAAGAADRSFSWAHASESKIMDPVIRGLLDKVEVGPPPTENLERYKQGCSVTIRTRDGRTSSSTVYAPRGAAVLGIRWEDVEEKYRALAPFARLSPQAIEASCKAIRELRNLKNIGALITLLR